MEENFVRRGECQETSGFLFSHQCGDFAARAAQCDKEICERHSVQDPTAQDAARVLCTTCGKSLLNPPSTRGDRANRHDPYYDDPYYYSYHYYTGYSHDNDAFTDSDEAAIGGATAAHELTKFEDDMGAS